jgi:hypothetical protein
MEGRDGRERGRVREKEDIKSDMLAGWRGSREAGREMKTRNA